MGLIETPAAPSIAAAFDDERAIVFPPNHVHEDAGKYKSQPESFFIGKAVRILVDVAPAGKVPAWIDCDEFFDDPESGRRLGRGKLRSTVRDYSDGAQLAFDIEEVFDVLDARLKLPEGGVWGGWKNLE